jgi:homoserine O-acetyltransferase
MRRFLVLLAIAVAVFTTSASAADYPKPQEGHWIARDFKFHTGEVMPELRLHYRTIGDPKNPAVLMLHGSSGSMVDAHHRLLTEGMGVKHLRLVMGNSMGGMHAWLWDGLHPDFMDALVPMASQPTPMSGRNWMMRRLIIDSVRNDPDWNGGNYTTQPKAVRAATVFFGIATSGGTLAYAKLAPTREAADKMLDARLAAPFTADANDFLYQWAASGDFDPTPILPNISAKLLLINAADDERNPPETGLTEQAMKQVKNGSLYLIPASEDTRGHGTTGNAKFYTKQLAKFLQDLPAAAR